MLPKSTDVVVFAGEGARGPSPRIGTEGDVWWIWEESIDYITMSSPQAAVVARDIPLPFQNLARPPQARKSLRAVATKLESRWVAPRADANTRRVDTLRSGLGAHEQFASAHDVSLVDVEDEVRQSK